MAVQRWEREADTFTIILPMTPKRVRELIDAFTVTMLAEQDRDFISDLLRDEYIAIAWNDETEETAVSWNPGISDGYSTKDLLWSYFAGFFAGRGEAVRFHHL